MRLLALLFVVAAVSAEVIDIKSCPGVSEETCTIHEIHISPCANKKSCRLEKGKNAEVSFDYTPHFSADKVLNTVVWGTLPWDAIQPDACQYTPCPVQDGKRATYNASMHIGKKLPDGKFEFNWSVFDEQNAANACCFRAAVLLRGK